MKGNAIFWEFHRESKTEIAFECENNFYEILTVLLTRYEIFVQGWNISRQNKVHGRADAQRIVGNNVLGDLISNI